MGTTVSINEKNAVITTQSAKPPPQPDTYRACPAGQAVVGVHGFSEGLFDEFSGFYCKDAKKINDPNALVTYQATGMDGKGVHSVYNKFICPTGSAINKIDYELTGNGWPQNTFNMGATTFKCAAVPGAPATSANYRFGANGGNGTSSFAIVDPNTKTPKENWYFTGFGPIVAKNASGSQSVGGLYTTMYNFSSELDARTDSKELAKCAVGSRAYNCFEYTPGTAASTEFMANYCSKSENAKDPSCMKWCGNPNNAGFCDAGVLEYCKTDAGKVDPYCSCVNSEAGQALAKCVDGNCINSGYLTTNMQKTACPSVINCDVQAALKNAGVSIAQGANIQQNCGATSVEIPGSNSETTLTTTMQLILLLLIVIVVSIFIAVIYMVKANRVNLL